MKSAYIGGALLCLFFMFTTNVYASNDNLTICHYTGNGNYQKISVDDDAVNGQGNGDHNSSNHQDGKDIIPAGYWDQNGRNWDSQGQAIYNNNCVVPTPSPSPTLSPSPTGTPYVTSSPSPTATASASPSDSPNETTIPSTTPRATTDPTPAPRTDLSDGRSDGRTESLGCLRPEDNCAKVASAQTNVPRELPKTGGNELLGNIIIGLIGIWLGFKIKSFTDGNQI